ncbi:MAG: biotin--[acetyl-CoA-carboxylase] ligase [Hyphomicrobiales bacterium]
MPDGHPFRALWLAAVDSTNEEARRLYHSGEAGPVWIVAEEQTAGRGRLGRSWVSEPGNLYATLLVTLPVPLAVAAQASLVAALAMADAVKALAPAIPVELKWPNDVLLEGEKVSGILVETLAGGSPGGVPLAIGCGLNLAHAPEGQRRPATCIARHGVVVSPRAALAALDRTLQARFAEWAEGRGFAKSREQWMAAAGGLGAPIEIDIGGVRTAGTFLGLDAEGSLRLKLADGAERTVRAGDVVPTSAQGARA